MVMGCVYFWPKKTQPIRKRPDKAVPTSKALSRLQNSFRFENSISENYLRIRDDKCLF